MHGGLFATCIVADATAEDAAVAAGWALTTSAALAGADVAPQQGPEIAEVTRESLLQLAAGRGIKVDGRWSDRRLAEMVA